MSLAARRARALYAIAGTTIVLVGAIATSVASGALSISWHATLTAIGKGLSGRAALLQGDEAIVWNLRLPRVLMATLVGASLGSSGAAMQGLFRNPLADPYLLGVASGASFGVAVAISLTGQLAPAFAETPIAPGALAATVPLFAFLGAVGAVLITMVLARSTKRAGSTSLLLAGVVVGAILLSLTTYLMLRDADRLRAVFSWTVGNLALASWADLARALPYAVGGGALLYAFARGLDALQLGEETARTLGINARAVKIGVIAGASLATASAVAFVGIIGFVGLVAPHAMRRLGTPQHRVLLPASALAGAALLVFADLGARTLVRPGELPVGVLTTLVGGPFFLWQLRRDS